MPAAAAWAQLLAAGVLEVVMAFALKASAGSRVSSCWSHHEHDLYSHRRPGGLRP
jgi:hypothetical protein